MMDNKIKLKRSVVMIDFTHAFDGRIPNLCVEGLRRIPNPGDNFWLEELLELAIKRSPPEYTEELMAKYFGLAPDGEWDDRYDEDASTTSCLDVTTSFVKEGDEFVELIRIAIVRANEYDRYKRNE